MDALAVCTLRILCTKPDWVCGALRSVCGLSSFICTIQYGTLRTTWNAHSTQSYSHTIQKTVCVWVAGFLCKVSDIFADFMTVFSVRMLTRFPLHCPMNNQIARYSSEFIILKSIMWRILWSQLDQYVHTFHCVSNPLYGIDTHRNVRHVTRPSTNADPHPIKALQHSAEWLRLERL